MFVNFWAKGHVCRLSVPLAVCPPNPEANYTLQGMSDEEMSVQRFRQRCVEPMGEESDHVHIVALTDALQARGP